MMKKVKKGSAIVALLALVLSTVVIPKAYAAKEVDLSKTSSMEFDLSSVTYEEVKDLSIAVDLYQVATIDKVGNYTAVDGYTLGTIDDKTTADAWIKMAEDAMAVIEENAVAPTATSTVEDGFAGLELGLYLVVANNAQSTTYEYSFTPYLVSLPNNYYYSQGNDAWVYDVTTSLKPERADLYGDLVITKDLASYNATVGGATFVFQVEATKNYKLSENAADDVKVVYSDVVSITFDAAGNKSVTIDNIPAGAEVTVTEVYSGGSYEAANGTEFTTVIVADEVVEAEKDIVAAVTFTNQYNGKLNGGTGVVNHFEEGENGWTWTVDPASAEVK